MRFRYPRTLIPIGAALLGACAGNPPHKPRPVPDHDIVAAIHAAGRRDDSPLHVTPLRDPDVQQMVDAAKAAEAAGHYPQAAQKLDLALAKAPDAPDILQDRAEVAIRMQHYSRAGQLAYRSWSHGPKLGSLCVRNWQTILEIRKLDGNDAGVASARKQREKCQVKAVKRM